MDEYIKRSDAVQCARDVANDFKDDGLSAEAGGADTVGDWLQDFPAADVRPVVMCRDCIHYEMGACLKIYDDGAANKDAWQERKPDDFCSYSEKREES